MAFGFPASFRGCLSDAGVMVSLPLQKVIKRVFHSLDWTIESESDGFITATTGINLWSWGERVVVDFFTQDSITVTSSCVRFTQFFDWGKNKSNVRKLFEAILKHAQPGHSL